MTNRGFLDRESYKLKFSDIPEIAVAAILFNKLPNSSYSSDLKITINISLLDFYTSCKSLEALEDILKTKKAVVKDRNTEYLTDMINTLLNVDFSSKEHEIDLIDYYNGFLETKLEFLQNGDDLELAPCIESFETLKSSDLRNFQVILIPKKFIEIHKKNLFESISFKDNLYEKFKNKIDDIGTRVTYFKQMEFALEYLNERQNITGESSFDFNLKEIKFRHLVSMQEINGDTFILPQALTTGPFERITLPFFMESIGLFDINSFKIGSSPLSVEDIEIFYSINKPSIYNRFLAKSFGLSSEQRKIMNESQIEIYENLYVKIAQKATLLARPELESQFCNILYWLLRKSSFCLEEPSYLKVKAEEWLLQNSLSKYVKMEDDFFLPFIYIQLREAYGDLVSKKPERFGGEVDILFGSVPIELKVRKDHMEPLSEIIDEVFKPASQAATYAAITRLGFVVVLDLPNTEKKVTNLSSCFNIIEKQFSEDSLSTQIVVCTFYCNLPKPSSARL